MPQDFDLIVIGAGSGGVAASRRAAAHGARVAIIERGRVGGTCVLRGCVPKKLLMYAAGQADAFDEARGYGWSFGEPSFDMARWQSAKTAETARLEGIYRRLLADSGVSLIEGTGRLAGPGAVQVDGIGGPVLRAPRVLLATGSAPVRDRVPGLEACATSDDLLDLSTLPAQAAVIGAGYIGVEFASMLARLGVKVDMYFRGAQPLRGFDADLREHAVGSLRAAGVGLHADRTPRSIERTSDGFRLLLAVHGAADEVVEMPWILNATGRRPNAAGLGLESVGVVPDDAGAVPVDDGLQTSAPGVYAVGDLTNRHNLTPVAIAEGRALADTWFGPTPRQVALDVVPSAVFMLPPLATVGPTEAQAVERVHARGGRLRVYETRFRPMRSAFAGSDERSMLKLLVDDDSDAVLAVHMAGPDAPEIVQSLSVAVTAGLRKSDFDRTLALHPTAAEEFVLMREPSRVV